MIMMGLSLIPVSRQSMWLDAANLNYADGIQFHRVAGWWCVGQTVLHSVSYVFYPMAVGFRDWEQYHSLNGTNVGATVPGEFAGTRWNAARLALYVYLFPWVTQLDQETGEEILNA